MSISRSVQTASGLYPCGAYIFVEFYRVFRSGIGWLLCLSLLLCLSACKREAPLLTGATMGTTYSVIVPHIKRADKNDLKSRIDAKLVAVNIAMSTYQNDSAISLFNNLKSTHWFAVPRSVPLVLNAALEIAEASGGAFDPTVGPLVRRWGFGDDQTTSLPSADEVARLLEQSGYTKLAVDNTGARIRKTDGRLQLDLNAIAKGYAVDQLASEVEVLGYTDYLVEIGGEVRVSGTNAAGKPWRIGIESPDLDGSGEHAQSGLNLTGGAVATSGDYRNAFEHNGQRYSHIIDARTGKPVSHALASVTVVAESAMLADGWATALMVLGPNQGMKIAETAGLACLFILRDPQTGFQIESSSAFRKLGRGSDH